MSVHVLETEKTKREDDVRKELEYLKSAVDAGEIHSFMCVAWENGSTGYRLIDTGHKNRHEKTGALFEMMLEMMRT